MQIMTVGITEPPAHVARCRYRCWVDKTQAVLAGSALGLSILLAGFVAPAHAQVSTLAPGVLLYGDEDLEGYGYPGGADPTVGASLIGVAANTVNLATNAYGHGYPFSPSPTDYPGTDQIYVGSNQTDDDDGYSEYSGRIAGPQVVTFDYSSLVGTGQTVTSLTFGIGADDFQYPTWGNPFTATINGTTSTVIANQLDALNQTGPYEQFFSVGIPTSALLSSDILTLTINEGGTGGDGWATDFFTIGVRTSATNSGTAPEPGSIVLLSFSGLSAGILCWRRRLGNR